MEITNVRVFPVNDEKLKAFVSIVLDDCFVVNDIRILVGRNGPLVCMPSRRRRNGELKDVAHPLNQETRRRFDERILEAFADSTGKSGEASEHPRSVEKAPEPTPAPATDVADRERSLEEVEEHHLKDSFWSLG